MNEIKPKKFLICYFDILGYKQLIEKIGEEEFLHYILCTIKTIEEVIRDNNKYSYPVQYHIFSDNVIIFSPLYTNNTENEILLSQYIKDISTLQRNLMGQHSIFIRGCITIGNLYYNGNFVYGSGLINAYQLENNKAIYPRIILDNKCIEMCSHKKSFANITFTSDFLVKEDEDTFFLNYLFGLGSSYHNYTYKAQTVLKSGINYLDTSSYVKLPDPFYSIDFSDNPTIKKLLHDRPIGTYYLVVHKILIEANLLQQKDERVREKYRWCKNFHNKICAESNLLELSIQ